MEALFALIAVPPSIGWYLTYRKLKQAKETPPKWGTPARKYWHVGLRDYHAQMVVEAGRAAKGQK